MTGLLVDMQNKNDYFFNKYQRQITHLEEELSAKLNIGSNVSDISDSDIS
jgi:hypothetical protein